VLPSQGGEKKGGRVMEGRINLCYLDPIDSSSSIILRSVFFCLCIHIVSLVQFALLFWCSCNVTPVIVFVLKKSSWGEMELVFFRGRRG
jgi:hypothetical protein